MTDLPIKNLHILCPGNLSDFQPSFFKSTNVGKQNNYPYHLSGQNDSARCATVTICTSGYKPAITAMKSVVKRNQLEGNIILDATLLKMLSILMNVYEEIRESIRTCIIVCCKENVLKM